VRSNVGTVDAIPVAPGFENARVQCFGCAQQQKDRAVDHPRLIAQLCGLERRTARSGKDSIDHAPGADDDIATPFLAPWFASRLISPLRGRCTAKQAASILLASSLRLQVRPSKRLDIRSSEASAYHALEALCVNSHNRLGLSGISRSSMPRPGKSSAFSIAWANSAPTGIAPAYPTPFTPKGFRGDGVTV
jgi:hypothetical protein